MAADPIPHELLLSHAGFLRRLARDLVRDPAAAEDAVQEVWLRALESPPRERANLRGWLRTVLTNLVRSKARGDSRRGARELEHGRGRGDDALEQESTLRSVTEAVLALDEPLRSTVLQHYFQGLTAAEIAERDHLPVSTVKSRLQRALEILRSRMQRTNGERWQAALLALTVPSKIGKGVILMSLKTKLAVGAALVLAAWLLVHEWPTDRAPARTNASSQVATALENEPARSSGTPVLESDAKPAVRIEQEPAANPASVPQDPPETQLTGSLLGPDGKPIRHARSAWCSITDERGARLTCDASQGGTYVFSGVPLGRYWLAAYAFGYRIANLPIELRADEPRLRKDVTLTPQPMLRIRVTTPEGRKLTDELRLAGADARGVELVPIATRERPGPLLAEAIGSLNNPFGIGHYWQSTPSGEKLPPDCMGVVLLDEDPPAFVSLLNWHAVLQTKEVHLGDEEVNFVLRLEDVLASAASIRVQVLDSDSRTPLAGARITLSNRGDEHGGGLSGADGFAFVEKIVPCDGQLTIVAKEHARRTLDVRALPGVLTDLGEVALEPELRLEAHVRDATGPVAGTGFTLLRFDRSSSRYRADGDYSYSSGADGRLSIPSLGRELYVLRTSNLDAINDPHDNEPKLVCSGVTVDLRSGVAPSKLEIQLVPATTLSLVLRGESDEHCSFRVSDEQLIQLVSGRFWWMTPHPLSLPPGKYRVELFDPAMSLLATKSVVLGHAPMTVELSR